MYDGLGRRRKGRTNTTLYDGWNPIQLKNGATVVENRLTGLGLDTYYARVRDGVVQSYVTDALGSTLQLRDAAQNPVTSYVYDPYGRTSANANTNLVKYTGREQDFADLYYYRNRYYKPSIGRFISEDPIGLAGGANLYAYVGDDPVNSKDPDGRFATTILQGIGTFILINKILLPPKELWNGEEPPPEDKGFPPASYLCAKIGDCGPYPLHKILNTIKSAGRVGRGDLRGAIEK